MPDNNPMELLQIAAEAAERAYAPYSKFKVGAALLTRKGFVFQGCNVESVSYGLTICAERSAVCSAIAAGRRALKAIAIVASGPEIPYPCGACRQVLFEFGGKDTVVYMASMENLEKYEEATLGELLPKSFEFRPHPT